MKQGECCNLNKDKGFNYCPMCGVFIGKYEHAIFQEALVEDNPHAVRRGEKRETHPSYAQLSFSRISSSNDGRKTLYGSTIRHCHTIAMRVYRSEKAYDDYSEHYFASNQPYIEIEMSQSQFAEAISSLNMGSGVPVTLRYLMGKAIPFCEELTLRQKADNKIASNFKYIINKMDSSIKRIDELSAIKGPLKVSEKNELVSLCNSVIQELQSNLPFFKQTIDEMVDKSIQQGKSEIDSMVQYTLAKLGMEKLQELTGSNLLLDK